MVWGALGDPNASIPTPQPVLMRPTLVDPADGSGRRPRGHVRRPGRARRRPRRRRSACGAGSLPRQPTRDVGKADMINNNALPDIEVDPETFADHHRRRDGRALPGVELPLAQLYSLF